MTKNEFYEPWELLQNSNFDLFGKDIDKSFNVYFDSLKHISVPDLKAVIKKYAQSNQKFPTIKQLLDIYKTLPKQDTKKIKHDKDGYRIVDCGKCDDIGLIPLRITGDKWKTFMARCTCGKCNNPRIPYAGELIANGSHIKICDCCKKNLQKGETKKYCQDCETKYYKK